MADLKVKISEFPLATESKDSDDIAILQDGVNKRIKTPKIEEKILEKVEERYVNKNKLGVSNGVATLGADGLLSINQRPIFDVKASFLPINLLSPPSEVDGVFVPTESGTYENYGNVEIDLNEGTYIITKIGNEYEKSLLYVQNPKSVDTISELRLRDGDFDGQIITLLGYYEAGDKEPLNYKWTSEQGVDDGGAVINTESGSWNAVFVDSVNVLDFGAKGDEVTDNTTMFKKCYSYSSKVNVIIPEGKYNIYDEIIVNEYVTTDGIGEAVLIQKKNNTALFVVTEKENVYFKNVQFVGVGKNDTASVVNSENKPIPTNARAFGVFFDRCNNIGVYNCNFKYFKNNAVRVSYCSKVNIQYNSISGTYPDESLPLGDTSVQQFGILVYSQSAAEFGATMLDVVNGNKERHNNSDIFISNNLIKDTAIAICVFPGFINVNINNNTTDGVLTQHSMYCYPYLNTKIYNNVLLANQQVGVKISCNVQASFYTPKDIEIYNNTISNTNSPGISLEMFDKYNSGSFTVSKSSVNFENVNINNNTIYNCFDSAMIIACTINSVVSNNNIYNVLPIGLREVINYRGCAISFKNNIIKDSNYGAIGGSSLPYYTNYISDNVLTDCCMNSINAYIELGASNNAFDFSTERYVNWYAKGAIIRNTTTDDSYIVLNTGVAGNTPPSGTSDFVSGEVTFRYIQKNININLSNNKFLVINGTLSERCVNLNNSLFTFKVSNNYADDIISNSRLLGQFKLDINNNFRNTSKVARVLSDVNSGNGRSEYFLNTIPTNGTYERGDITWNTNTVSIGDPIGWVCITRGTPGTWRPFGSIGLTRSLNVVNSTVSLPSSDTDSNATDVAGVVVDFNDLVSKYNTLLLVVTDLQTKLNAKLTADRNSGQQAT